MKIIIIGCGKVGSTLAIQLSKEDNDICVIDTNRERVSKLATVYDIFGVCGNGSNYSVLAEAGIAETDLVIAVTGSDELNLLCCVIAQKAGKCRVIARVRNPVYEQESGFLQRELGLSMIINPEYLTAKEIFHLLCFPNASEIGFFSRGQAETVRYRIPEDSILDDMHLYEVASMIKEGVLVCALERNGVVTIPKGDTVLHSGDMISILTTRKGAVEFFRKIKARTNPVKNTMIVGGGKITVYLARMLIRDGIDVKVIEQDLKRCEELSDLIPEAAIINGDGSDKELLKEERIENADSFVALTNFDEENILLSLFANKLAKEKVITKINRFQLNEVIDNLDLDSVIYPKNLTTEKILQYVRSTKTKKSVDSKIKTLYRLYDDQVEALEFVIREDSKLTNVPLKDLELKENILIGCITRDGKSIIPNGQDEIKEGDAIIVFTTTLGLDTALDILK